MEAVQSDPGEAAEPTLESIAQFMSGLARHRLHWGLSGHLAVRLQGKRIAINPAGVPLAAITADNVTLLDFEAIDYSQGRSFAGLSTAQLVIENPHLNCALHLHMPYAHAWSATGIPIPAHTTDTLELRGRQIVQDPFASPARLSDFTRIIWHRHHGLTALGESPEEAGFYLLATERGAREQFMLAPLIERLSLEEAPERYGEIWSMNRHLAETSYRTLWAEAESAS